MNAIRGNPNIQYIESVENSKLYQLYKVCKVSVLPSWFETPGLVSLEAAAMGCNIVVSKYLKTLIDLGIVKKETPVTEKPGKKTIYLLADNFFRFWYRFVPVNMSAIDSGRIAKTYPHAVKQYLPDYMGLIFEKMCQDYLLYYADSLPMELSEIGQWWGTDPKQKKQIQIDIVGTPVDGRDYLIGSCKYRNEKIGVDELDLIRDYAAVFGKGSSYHYYIFSKDGFTDGLLQAQERGEVRLVTLEGLYR